MDAARDRGVGGSEWATPRTCSSGEAAYTVLRRWIAHYIQAHGYGPPRNSSTRSSAARTCSPRLTGTLCIANGGEQVVEEWPGPAGRLTASAQCASPSLRRRFSRYIRRSAWESSSSVSGVPGSNVDTPVLKARSKGRSGQLVHRLGPAARAG